MIEVEKRERTRMKRVLIVEDNAFFRQFLKETMSLRFPSIDIFEAGNGEEAMEKIKNLSPEAILMDLRLPGENGLDLTRKIKAEYPDIVVVILTNYDLPEYRQASYQAGANHFVSKDSFMDMINSILSNQDVEGGNSNSGQPVEGPSGGPRPSGRRSEMSVRDRRKNE